MFQVKALAGSVPSSGSVASAADRRSRRRRRRTMPSCGDRIVAVGGLPTLIVIGVRQRAC